MPSTKNRISAITVRGFKSIGAEQRVEFKPLTILAGANSSGKSSLMQPLLLLKQTLEAPGDPGALLLDGPNVRFTSADQLLSRTLGKGVAQDFSIRLELLDKQSLDLLFRREEGKGFEIEQMIHTSGKDKVTITPDMTHEDILRVLPPALATLHKEIGEKEGPFRWRVFRQRCFLSFELTSGEMASRRYRFDPYGVSPSVEYVPYILAVIHLAGLRGNPLRTYPKAAGGPDFPGTFESYVATVISQWQSDGDKKLEDLAKALEQMGLTWKVQAAAVGDTQVELKVGRLVHPKRGGASDLVSIADVGFGVSQSLPVVVALLAARSGQLVYLEQPEIHLHPMAQRKLAIVLRDAVKRGVIAVVETHSALLLREIQTMVATRQMSKDDIKLHWLQRGQDGMTKVTTADLDERGAYGAWPEDFDRTELEAEKAYLDAAEFPGDNR